MMAVVLKVSKVVFEETILSNYKEIAKQNVGTALCVTGICFNPDAKTTI